MHSLCKEASLAAVTDFTAPCFVSESMSILISAVLKVRCMHIFLKKYLMRRDACQNWQHDDAAFQLWQRLAT